MKSLFPLFSRVNDFIYIYNSRAFIFVVREPAHESRDIDLRKQLKSLVRVSFEKGMFPPPRPLLCRACASRIRGGHSNFLRQNDCHYCICIRLECLSVPRNVARLALIKIQYPACIRERTMRTRTILVACLAIATFDGFSASVEVSSKIELDSDERADISSNLALDTTDLTESTSPSESVLRTQSKQQAYSRRRGSELVKTREPRKRRIDILRVSNANFEEVIARSRKCIRRCAVLRKVERS